MQVLKPTTILDALLTASNVAEPSGTDPAVWSAGTSYNLGDTVIVIGSDVHTIYKSLQNGNLGNDPVADAGTFRNPINTGTWWVQQGATNAWKMFDKFNQSQTTNADTINVTIDTGTIVNGVAALNIDGNTIQVIVDDPTEGVVYDKTRNLIYDSGITNWYDYYFTQIEQITDIVIDDLPAYKDASVQVILDKTGSTAKMGVLAVGTLFTIGSTSFGMTGSIIDYSRKEVDEFGNFTILQRSFSKRREYDILVQTNRTGTIENFLAANRITPMIWIGNPDYPLSIAYGYYRDFSILLSDTVNSNCSLQIEGLT